MLRFRFSTSWDLMAAMGVAIAGAVASHSLGNGSSVRLVLALSALFLAPGYLLLQATLKHVSDPRRRGRDVLLAPGLSVPIIGLLALVGALWPGAFGAGGFAVGLLVGCSLLACVAFARRSFDLARGQAGMAPPASTAE